MPSRLVERWRLRCHDYLVRISKRASRAGLYEFLTGEYAAIESGDQVLTVGSGGEVNALLQQYAQQRGFRVTSFDISAERHPDILGDVCSHDLGESRFDRIVLCEVLEHLHAPAEALQRLHRALKPGGRIIVSAPFCLPMHDRPHDYFRFTRYGLELLFREFSGVEIRARNSYFEAIDVLWMRLVMEQHRRLPLILVLATFIYYVKRPFTLLLDRLVRVDGLTTGYVLVASK